MFRKMWLPNILLLPLVLRYPLSTICSNLLLPGSTSLSICLSLSVTVEEACFLASLAWFFPFFFSIACSIKLVCLLSNFRRPALLGPLIAGHNLYFWSCSPALMVSMEKFKPTETPWGYCLHQWLVCHQYGITFDSSSPSMRPLLHTAIRCWQGSPSTRGTPQFHVPKNEPLVSLPGIRVVYLFDEVRWLTTQQYVSPCVSISMIVTNVDPLECIPSQFFTLWSELISTSPSFLSVLLESHCLQLYQ